MAKESARLKEEAEMMKLNNTSDVSMSPAARSSRIFALENMLATSSTTLVSMASQLSEAEERERVFSGKGRWNQVRSLADAKNLMNFLFNLASSSRCSLREKEFICRDKDMEIFDLKQKIVSLIRSLEQLKRQRDGLDHQLKLMRSESMRDSGYYVGGHPYDLRKLENRRSTILFEDMEISDAESDEYGVDATDDEWVMSAKLHGRKRKSKGGDEHSNLEKNHSNTSSVDAKTISTEAPDGPSVKTASDVCCSCSRSSSCKTSKCACRAMGIGCGSSCGCRETKCANREGGTVNDPGSDEADKNRLLATQGAELLQGALVGPAEANSDHGPRKALSDIGNTLVCPSFSFSMSLI